MSDHDPLCIWAVNGPAIPECPVCDALRTARQQLAEQIANELEQHHERLKGIAADGAMDDYQAGQGLAYGNALGIVRRIGGLDDE